MNLEITNNQTNTNIRVDVLKFGMALIFAHIFAGLNFVKNNFEGPQTILYSLIGLAVYQAVIAQIYVTKHFPLKYKVLIDDLIKFTTMLFITKFLINKNEIFSVDFILGLINILIGFMVYNLFIVENVTKKFIKDSMKFSEMMIVDDVLKYGSVLLISGFLNKLFGLSEFNRQYLQLTGGYVFGMVSYDLLLA